MNKSDARISLEFYIRDGLANRAHITGITAEEKAEIVVEDVISNLLDPYALRAILRCAKEQDVKVPLPPLRLQVDLAVSGYILQDNFDITDKKDIVCETNGTQLLIFNTHKPE